MIGSVRTSISAVTAIVLFMSAPTWAAETASLKRTVLTQGGVALYEFSARAEDGVITLDLPRDHVDDALKSLAVLDARAGIATVTLPGEAALSASIGGSGIGEQTLDSLPRLLRAMRGEDVEVSFADSAVTGRIVTVDMDGAEESRALTLRRETGGEETGMIRIPVADIRAVRFTDAAIEDRIGNALDTISAARGDTRRLVITLSGARTGGDIALAYVGPAPMWKSVYRLHLDGNKGTLQGWAVLENFSGADWTGVDLTLSAGNPVTVRQALYRAHFVDRPEVPVELFDRLSTTLDAGTMDMAREEAFASAPMMQNREMLERGKAAVGAVAVRTEESERAARIQFHLGDSIDLPHGQTLTLPLIEEAAPATRVTYVAMHDNRPLAAFRIENRADTALPPGVVTVYDRGRQTNYLGDAQIGVVPPGEERLLAFAEDATVRVERRQTASTRIGRARAVNGVLEVIEIVRHVQAADVIVPRRADQQGGRTMVIDFAAPDQWKMVAPETGINRIGGGWRVTAALDGGDRRTVEARFEDERQRRFSLLDADTAVLAEFASNNDLDRDIRTAMERIVTLRRAEAAARRALTERDAALETARRDEERARENLKAVGESQLRQQYLDRLVAGEALVNDRTQERETAAETLARAEAALRDFVQNLKIDF
ncbi:MAG: DUF4139 domain-containing protein [Sphingomonadales bacterium]